MTDIWTSSSIHDLSEDDLKNFQEIVLRDVKNKPSHEDKTILINNLDLWLYSLRIIRREIELQLSNHKANLKVALKEMKDSCTAEDEIQEHIFSEERWRNNAMKFLNSIERKTLYVKLVLEEEKEN